MRLRIRWWALGAVIMLAGLGATVVSYAEPADRPFGPELQLAAREKGITVDEAEQIHHWREQFRRAVRGIETTMPERFAGAAMTGDYAARVRFVGAVPEQAERLFADLPAVVEVELEGGFAYSLPDLVGATERAHLKLHADAAVQTVTSYVDEDRQVIEFHVQPRTNDKSTWPAINDHLSRHLADLKFPSELTLHEGSQGRVETGS